MFIAGGVGLTPMLSMLRTLRDRGDKRRHHLIIGARSLDDLMLRAEITELAADLDVRVTEVVQTRRRAGRARPAGSTAGCSTGSCPATRGTTTTSSAALRRW